MTIENKKPKFVVDAFIMNAKGELLLRTTPSQAGKYTCINAGVEWNQTIEEALHVAVASKTKLEISKVTFLGLTEALDIQNPKSDESLHMLFADHRVDAADMSTFEAVDVDRTYTWLSVREWLAKDPEIFGQYIFEILPKLA